MPYFTTPKDSALLFYRDYIPPPRSQAHNSPTLTILFLHGWPMSSLMFSHLMVPLTLDHNLRCIAPDRRGFGNSDWNGTINVATAAERSNITYETFADDIASLIESLEIGPFICLAASMGCGESLLLRERSAYAKTNCKGLIFLGPNLPDSYATPNNPIAPSMELWESIIAGIRTSRSDFVSISLPGVFGIPAGATVSQKGLEYYERIVSAADALAIELTLRIILAHDFTLSMKSLASDDVPLTILHGDSDTGMPFEASTKIIKGMIPRAQVKIYKTAGHGLYLTHAEQVLADVMEVVRKTVPISRGNL